VEERSAGAVIFYERGSRKYLLLKNPGGNWGFPKGNIEEGEDEIQTAEREIKEETGINDFSFVGGFRERISYFYRKGNRTIYKTVVYFLAKARTDKVKISWEHDDYVWLSYTAAMRYIAHANSKKVLSKAEEYLNAEDKGKQKKFRAELEDVSQRA
jgi:8-oxo-dGTP pyrophosphatase MutT (NUDIX family)